jgi:hypothetical protein
MSLAPGDYRSDRRANFTRLTMVLDYGGLMPHRRHHLSLTPRDSNWNGAKDLCPATVHRVGLPWRKPAPVNISYGKQMPVVELGDDY